MNCVERTMIGVSDSIIIINVFHSHAHNGAHTCTYVKPFDWMWTAAAQFVLLTEWESGNNNRLILCSMFTIPKLFIRSNAEPAVDRMNTDHLLLFCIYTYIKRTHAHIRRCVDVVVARFCFIFFHYRFLVLGMPCIRLID